MTLAGVSAHGGARLSERGSAKGRNPAAKTARAAGQRGSGFLSIGAINQLLRGGATLRAGLQSVPYLFDQRLNGR